MNLKEEIRKIFEEYAGQMVSRGLDTIYSNEKEIDKVVELILKLIEK